MRPLPSWRSRSVNPQTHRPSSYILEDNERRANPKLSRLSHLYELRLETSMQPDNVNTRLRHSTPIPATPLRFLGGGKLPHSSLDIPHFSSPRRLKHRNSTKSAPNSPHLRSLPQPRPGGTYAFRSRDCIAITRRLQNRTSETVIKGLTLIPPVPPPCPRPTPPLLTLPLMSHLEPPHPSCRWPVKLFEKPFHSQWMV